MYVPHFPFFSQRAYVDIGNVNGTAFQRPVKKKAKAQPGERRLTSRSVEYNHHKRVSYRKCDCITSGLSISRIDEFLSQHSNVNDFYARIVAMSLSSVARIACNCHKRWFTFNLVKSI